MSDYKNVQLKTMSLLLSCYGPLNSPTCQIQNRLYNIIMTTPKMNDRPDPPTPTVESILRTDTAYEIFTQLTSGWSPHRISRMLAQKGIQVTPLDINEYMHEIPPAYFLPTSYIRKRLLKLDIQIDALGELARLLRIQEERVGVVLLVEEQNPQQLTTQTSRMVKDYFKMLIQFAELQQKVGELPTEPTQIDVTSGGEPLPTLKELLSTAMDADEAE